MKTLKLDARGTFEFGGGNVGGFMSDRFGGVPILSGKPPRSR